METLRHSQLALIVAREDVICDLNYRDNIHQVSSKVLYTSDSGCQLVEQRSIYIRVRCKRLILKLSKVLIVEEVKGPYMYPNQRLNPI
jgi:hypothetical protein